jgi:hypothetical protein
MFCKSEVHQRLDNHMIFDVEINEFSRHSLLFVVSLSGLDKSFYLMDYYRIG